MTTSARIALYAVLVSCPAVLRAEGPAPATQPTTQAADTLKGAVDPYDSAAERVKFFKATGVESEMTEEMFKADAKAGGNFARPFDSWRNLLIFDKNSNGKIDWFEADAYRQALREKVLEMFDKKKAGSLGGEDRQTAIAFLATRAPYLAAGAGVFMGTGGKAFDMAAYAEANLGAPLNNDQKKKLADIQAAYEKADAQFDKDNGSKMQDAWATWRDASKRKDKATADKASKEFMDMRNLRQEAFNKSQEEMVAVLTGEQKTQWGRKIVTGQAKGFYGPIELSDEQIDKVRNAFGDDLLKANTAGNCNIIGKLRNVLTPEQLAAGEKHFAMNIVQNTYSYLKLTDEQVKHADAAWDEIAKDKSLNAYDAVMKLEDKVKASLTDEQKETMRKRDEETKKALQQLNN